MIEVNGLTLFVLILACYRLAQLAAIDEGPAGLCLKLRTALGGYDLKEDGEPRSNIGRGIICPYCVGVWFAFPLAFFVAGPVWQVVIYWLAIAGGQALLWSLRNDN